MVQPEKQLFHCFGCQTGGDVFSFLMKYENLTFPEALKMLADRAHITLPERGFPKEDNSQKEKIYEIYQHAAVFYQKLFQTDLLKQCSRSHKSMENCLPIVLVVKCD